ncbi:DUF7487 domain-containing protein [Tissierella praeacuta]|uniref:DUF7487 domain-containing protein n=1 Tax=Tissierella praeacuta TaxID=43131 RepID=UPI003DA35AE7
MNHSCEVKAEDLTKSSQMKVKVQCDYCGDIIEKTFAKYIKQRNVIAKDSCYKCFPIKQKEVCNAVYGVDSTFQLEDVQQKSLKSINDRYGVDNVMQYPDVQEKYKATMMERYGTEYAQQSSEIRNKTQQTLVKKYGVNSVIEMENMKIKCNNFEYVNSKKVSKSQKKISQHLNGHLNVNIGGYFADIWTPDSNLIIEYDGSGHDLSVKLGSVSQEDFDERENIKRDTFLNHGYNYLVIANPTGKSITKLRLKDIDEQIQKMKDKDMSYAILNIQ